MRYALLAYGDPTLPGLTDEERAALAADDAAFHAEITDRGFVVSAEGLHEPGTATTVRVRGIDAVVTDGPAAEPAGRLAGFVVIDVPDLDTALDVARRAPAARVGSLEIRPVQAG